MAVNIFGSGNNDLYDIVRDLDLNGNTIHNVKDPENEHDVTNKRYVDSKSSSGDGWTLEGNAIQSDGKMGTLNNNSLTFIRNTIPQMAFLSNHIVAYKSFYLEKGDEGGYIGMQSLTNNKEFGIFFGNSRNMITWKNSVNQLMRFTASTGFLFSLGRNTLMIMTADNGIQILKNINMGNNRIINLPAPVDSTDCATKAYSDLKVLKTGDTMTGDLNITLNSDELRTFGVRGVDSAGKAMTLLLGNTDNQIRHNFGHPIKVAALHGTMFSCSLGDICRMGAMNDPRAYFFKDIVMNNKFIAGLRDPVSANDAVTKQYVDRKFVKNNVGYIPHLESNNSTTGFFISSSAILGPGYPAYGAFNNMKADGSHGSWGALNAPSWLKIKCPDPVRIWKVMLKARPIAGRNITSWSITASNDDTTFEEILASTNVLLGATTEPSFFEINTLTAYRYYSFNILTCEGPNPGIQTMQLYTCDALSS